MWNLTCRPCVYLSPFPVGNKSKISEHLFVYLPVDLGSLLLILRHCFPDQVAESQNKIILKDQESNINSW